MKNKKIGFIGIGKMGRALMMGFHESRRSKEVLILAYDENAEARASVGADIVLCASAGELVRTCDYIVLAVKPQQLPELLLEIKGDITPDKVLVSICAGITADYIRKRTLDNAKVVLVMPNTPCMLGLGSSTVAADKFTGEQDFEFVRGVIGSCGITEVVPMNKMNESICLNGSSPAFIYLFAKGFTEYAAEQGIDEYAALNLFSHALTGAAKMLTSSGMTIDELIEQVSSKGGTTLAGLDELYKGGLVDVVKKACASCTKRAYELGASQPNE